MVTDLVHLLWAICSKMGYILFLSVFASWSLLFMGNNLVSKTSIHVSRLTKIIHLNSTLIIFQLKHHYRIYNKFHLHKFKDVKLTKLNTRTHICHPHQISNTGNIKHVKGTHLSLCLSLGFLNFTDLKQEAYQPF